LTGKPLTVSPGLLLLLRPDYSGANEAQGDVRVLVAFVADLVAFDPLLFLADISPDFVKLDAASANANDRPIVKLGTAATDALAKTHDGIAVNAGKALGGADALAFGQAGDDRNLLVAGKGCS
jgi:hypothetical protein